MQKRELFAKLTQARQAQAQAMRRFAKIQARLAQLEAGLRVPSSSQSQETEQQATYVPNPAFLPENGDLESQNNFAVTPRADEETERIARSSPEISSAPLIERRMIEDTPGSSLILSAEEQL